jgi:hypothetical protein
VFLGPDSALASTIENVPLDELYLRVFVDSAPFLDFRTRLRFLTRLSVTDDARFSEPGGEVDQVARVVVDESSLNISEAVALRKK